MCEWYKLFWKFCNYLHTRGLYLCTIKPSTLFIKFKIMKKILLISALIFAGSYFTANAQTQDKTHSLMVSDSKGWHKIGETTVNFTKEREEILVTGADRFASIKFKVMDAPIQLTDLEVYFESGDKQVIKVNSSIKAAGESRVIDIKGGERDLKKVVFVYKTLPNRKDDKAHVEIWGFKTNTDKK